MKILIVGLGLIGGSICKSLKKNTEHEVYACNRTVSKVEDAIKEGAADGIGDPENEDYHVIWNCLYKNGLEKWIEDYASKLKKGTIIADVCGLKGEMTEKLTKLCKAYGLRYVGTHPMAGKEVSGYYNSDALLFNGCNFIITPVEDTDGEAVEIIRQQALEMGSGRIVISSPYDHDKMIAFSSHIPHILANSYMNNPLAEGAAYFGGGAMRDVSRVATMEETMWAELFLENKQPLLEQIDIVIKNITSFRELIAEGKEEELKKLIISGTEEKLKQLEKLKK